MIFKVLFLFTFLFNILYFTTIAQSPEYVEGYVYADLQQNGNRSLGDPGIPGVMVSNQYEVVITDENGYFMLPAREEMIVFIAKPAGYKYQMDHLNIPRFYYIHRPDGSPKLNYAGLDPTGPMPEMLNFGLIPAEEKETFSAIVFGDPQTLNDQQLSWFRDAFAGEFSRENADIILALGDIMYDNLSLYQRYNEIMSIAGKPVVNVFGNHDLNFDAGSNRYARETFKSHYGPTYFSFEEGDVHFIVIDNIDYLGYNEQGRPGYIGNIGEAQLAWLKNNLQWVAKDKLIVILGHIPLYAPGRDDNPTLRTGDREKLFALLEDFDNVLFLGGHVHSISHSFLGSEFGRNNSNPIHQILVAAASGSWWGGPTDKNGIPTATQRDGSPKGYHLFTFRGNTYSEQLKPSGLDAGYQIRIESPIGNISPESLENIQIRANVFNSSKYSEVIYRLNDGEWTPMVRDELSFSGFFKEHLDKHQEHYSSWIAPMRTSNIWVAPLQSTLPKGVHRIDVKTTDMYGQEFNQTKVLEVKGD